MSAYFPVLEKNVLIYMSAYFSPLVECADISMCWHMCQHLDLSAYMSASGHVNILASTRTNVLTYMSTYLSPLVECVGMPMCCHVCQHLDVSAYMSASGHVNTLTGTRTNVLTHNHH